MGTQSYVALLRGINVGGRNLISMANLREAFSAFGCQRVRTYIQSGNVVFESDGPAAPLEVSIETMLERRFGVRFVAVVRSRLQMRNIVDRAPDHFGEQPGTYHSDVIFLKSPLSSRQAMRVVEICGEVDQAWPGAGVLYFARLSARRTQSRLSRIVGTPEYKMMTIRTWTTTTRLLGLLEDGTLV